MNKISGLYKITNNITGDFYIGSSKDIKERFAKHKCISTWKQWPNLRMYQDMTKYGLDNFTFEIIEETDNLREREQYWIEQLRPIYNDKWAKGWDLERYKETQRNCDKRWHKAHKEERRAYNEKYSHKLCLYENETLYFQTLSARFRRHGIPNPTQEAKKFLIENN